MADDIPKTKREPMAEVSISLADVVLAVLWKAKPLDRQAIMRHSFWRAFASQKSPNTFWTTLHRLFKQEFIVESENALMLTALGSQDAVFAYITVQAVLWRRPTQAWDGGWRMLFFDIPESKRFHRDFIRRILKIIGFREFQRSVWIYPFQAPIFLRELFAQKDIHEHVKFITAGKIENDSEFKSVFKLTKK